MTDLSGKELTICILVVYTYFLELQVLVLPNSSRFRLLICIHFLYKSFHAHPIVTYYLAITTSHSQYIKCGTFIHFIQSNYTIFNKSALFIDTQYPRIHFQNNKIMNINLVFLIGRYYLKIQLQRR